MDFTHYFRSFTKTLGTTPFHPQYFSKVFLDRQIKKHSTYLIGIVLDTGCGAGPYKKYFLQSQYIGMDYIHKDSDYSSLDRTVDLGGNLMELPLKNTSLAGVICTQVLEHVQNPFKAVTEIARVLKPGGKLLLTAPFFYPLHDEPYDFFRFSSYGLTELLSDAGFEIVELEEQSGFIKMAAELLNLFCIHRIKKLFSSNGYFMLFGIFLTPFFLIVATLINITACILSVFDRDNRFVMNYFVFAERRSS